MKLRFVCNRLLFLAAIAVLACIVLPSADAQKISETFLVSSLFQENNGGMSGAAFNSKGEEVFGFPGNCPTGLNIYDAKTGNSSVVQPEQTLAYPFCPQGVASDSAGNFWFVDTSNQAVGFMNAKGVFTEYPAPNDINSGCNEPGCVSFGNPAITLGSDGAMWVTGSSEVSPNVNNPMVARVTSDGTYTYYPISFYQSTDVNLIASMATGADGNVYFRGWLGTDLYVFQVTPAGQINRFSAPGCGYGAGEYQSMTPGSDGNVWFVANCDAANNVIASITPSGVITTFPTATSPWSIASGSDGAIWFIEGQEYGPNSDQIGRMTTSGAVTYITSPDNQLSEYTGCASGNEYYLSSIFAGPKGTMQYIGYNVTGSAPCTYVGSFTPSAPGDDQQEEASREKHKSDLTVSCGPGGVDKCVLVTFPTTKITLGALTFETDSVHYTFVNNQPKMLVSLQDGADFGLCNITNKQGYAVFMQYSYITVGEIPQQGKLFPSMVEAWLFPGLSAAKTGATQGQKYICSFPFELYQSLNGGQFVTIAAATIIKEGEVGP